MANTEETCYSERCWKILVALGIKGEASNKGHLHTAWALLSQDILSQKRNKKNLLMNLLLHYKGQLNTLQRREGKRLKLLVKDAKEVVDG